MPLEFQRRNVDEDLTGYIFGTFSLAVIVGSPFVSLVIQRFGRRRTLMVACVTMTISVSAYAAITHFQSKGWFIAISFVARLFQGAASVAI
jgi:MFS family permease